MTRRRGTQLKDTSQSRCIADGCGARLASYPINPNELENSMYCHVHLRAMLLTKDNQCAVCFEEVGLHGCKIIHPSPPPRYGHIVCLACHSKFESTRGMFRKKVITQSDVADMESRLGLPLVRQWLNMRWPADMDVQRAVLPKELWERWIRYDVEERPSSSQCKRWWEKRRREFCDKWNIHPRNYLHRCVCGVMVWNGYVNEEVRTLCYPCFIMQQQMRDATGEQRLWIPKRAFASPRTRAVPLVTQMKQFMEEASRSPSIDRTLLVQWGTFVDQMCRLKGDHVRRFKEIVLTDRDYVCKCGRREERVSCWVFDPHRDEVKCMACHWERAEGASFLRQYLPASFWRGVGYSVRASGSCPP